MSSNFNKLRSQARGKTVDGAPQPARQVVQVQRVTEDIPDEEKTESADHVPEPSSQIVVAPTPETVEPALPQEPTPAIQPTPTPAIPLLGGNIDVGALIKQAEEADGGDETEEGLKITVYLEPSQATRLEALVDHLNDVVGRDPKMLQLIFRYLMDTLPLEAFDGFSEYVQSKRLARVLELEQKHLQRALIKSLQRQRKALRPKNK